jgi:hypothetical protein
VQDVLGSSRIGRHSSACVRQGEEIVQSGVDLPRERDHFQIRVGLLEEVRRPAVVAHKPSDFFAKGKIAAEFTEDPAGELFPDERLLRRPDAARFRFDV